MKEAGLENRRIARHMGRSVVAIRRYSEERVDNSRFQRHEGSDRQWRNVHPGHPCTVGGRTLGAPKLSDADCVRSGYGSKSDFAGGARKFSVTPLAVDLGPQ
ncbi:hypothetical protein TNCV_3950021 [Trichonephila clavipes]|nr:hypothetical protein TNCV_3950021 [Trichonephila clavipes]